MAYHARYYPPGKSITGFVSTFWVIENTSGIAEPNVVVPDAYFELVLSKDRDGEFEITLVGLGTQYEERELPGHTKMFGISFTLLAVEYLFHHTIAHLVDGAVGMPVDFMGFSEQDLYDTEKLMQKANDRIAALIPTEIDSRKKELFALIYASNGAMTVKELSEKVFWSSRQINRYFKQNFGISLKTYCDILRFRASFEQLQQGKLFPEQDFSDQPHFIREVKKFSGVKPKEIFKNKNDRFIQFAALRKK